MTNRFRWSLISLLSLWIATPGNHRTYPAHGFTEVDFASFERIDSFLDVGQRV